MIGLRLRYMVVAAGVTAAMSRGHADPAPERRVAGEVNVLWPFIGISELKIVVPLFGDARFRGELVAGVYDDYAQIVGSRARDPGKVWLLASLVGYRQFFAHGIHAEVSVIVGVRHEDNYEGQMGVTLNDFYARAFPMVGWQHDLSDRFYVNARGGLGVLLYRETHQAEEQKIVGVGDLNLGARF